MKTMARKHFLTLWGAGAVGSLAILPILKLLHGNTVAFVFTAASLLVVGAAAWIGVALREQIGLGQARLREFLPFGLIVAILVGIGVGFAVIAGDAVFAVLSGDLAQVPSVPAEPSTTPGEQLSTSPDISPVSPRPLQIFLTSWQGTLMALYGGLAEEIIFRLGLLTLIVWVLRKAAGARCTQKWHIALLVWKGILLAAIVSGFAHLPVMASFSALSALLIFRLWLLGFIPAIIFGWLYWKKGLPAAMTAHFTGELFVFVFVPLVA